MAITLLESYPGTYALVLHLHAPQTLTVGALGAWAFPAGDYVYVGSAWGPGGVAARLGRHLRGADKVRWHIDYVRRVMQPIYAWVAYQKHLECAWAAHLLALPQSQVIVPRFGASDCHCVTHFLYITGQTQAIHFPSATTSLDLTTLSPVLY